MASITEGLHNKEGLISEAAGHRSREEITVASGQNLAAMSVVGKLSYEAGTDTGTAAAFAGNTGDGVFGDIAVGAGAKKGVYTLTITEPATNAGVFRLEDPDGELVGTGNVAAAFSAGGIGFTLADGATDFVAGDGFTITVGAGSDEYAIYDPTAADGSEVVAGILLDAVDASSAAKQGVILARDAEVNSAELTWFSGATAGQKTAGLAALALLGIIGR